MGRGRVKEEQGENNVKESNRKERVHVKESGMRGREEDRGVEEMWGSVRVKVEKEEEIGRMQRRVSGERRTRGQEERNYM